MKVAVVILNWNGITFLKKFLPVLIQYSNRPDVEIVVADNGSTDASLHLVATEFPSVKTVVLDANYGFAGGYNKALAQIEAQYYVLLNSDVEVTENWLMPLVNYMDEHLDVAACQPKIKAYHRKDRFEHAGAAGGFIDFLGFPFCRGRLLSAIETDNGQYDEVIDVFWATGACLFIRAEMFHKTGGFDDAFFAHMEEIDLCWRLHARGQRIVCVPQSAVYHVGGGTLHVEHPHKTYLNFRNNLLMLYKNLPQKSMKRVLAWRFWIDYLAALQLAITGKPANALAVLKARRDYNATKHQFAAKRNENLRYATFTNCEQMYKKSMLLAYFLKNKRTYKALMAEK